MEGNKWQDNFSWRERLGKEGNILLEYDLIGMHGFLVK